jgi:hypothetical protein
MPTTRNKRYASKVPTPPAPRRLRSLGGPVCSDFGRYRTIVWQGRQGYFFCSNCDLFDNEAISSKKVKRTSNVFRCKAKHTSYTYPTDLLKNGGLFRPSKNPAARSVDDGSDDDESVDGGVSSVVGDTNEGSVVDSDASSVGGGDGEEDGDDESAQGDQDWMAIAAGLKKQVEDLKQKNTAQRGMIHRMKRKMKVRFAANTTLPVSASAKKKANDNNFKTSIGELLEEYYTKWYPKWGRLRKGKLLARAFWDLMDGVAQDGLMVLVKDQIRKTTYHPFNVLRAMDFAGGTLSYEGIEVLRQCETEGEKYVRGTVIPCSAELRRVATMIEKFGNQLCPYKLDMTEDGEMFTFDFAKTVKMLVESHGEGTP